MIYWRLVLAILLTLLIGVPVLLPLRECLTLGDPAWLVTEAGDLYRLTGNTLRLIAGTVALSLPVGTFLAVLLFRTDLPGRRLWILATLLVLFIPLPLLMSAWQAFAGAGGWYAALAGGDADTSARWTTGLWPCIWVHSLAGIPWVVLIVGNGLCWIERDLEEEALMLAGPWRVLWQVTLPRCGGSLAAAALWLGLATFGEIGVTYFLQYPTLAEEVHTQFSSGNRQALSRAVFLSLPMTFALTGLLLWQIPRMERALPPLQGWLAAPRRFPLGWGRWPMLLILTCLGTILLLVPLGSLVWKVGLAGIPQAWSIEETWTRLAMQSRLSLKDVIESFVTAAGTALATAALGLTCCWLAQGSRWFRGLILVLLILAWSLPAPVIGIGLKELIMALKIEPFDTLLYQGPSPLPIMWAQMIRFLPLATALLWPWVRTVPRELLESARSEGAGPLQELVQVIWPMVARGFAWTTLILLALCLGDVAVSTRVQTPGWETFAKKVFDQMHYGVDSTVAAMCLTLLGWMTVLTAVFLGGAALVRRAM